MDALHITLSATIERPTNDAPVAIQMPLDYMIDDDDHVDSPIDSEKAQLYSKHDLSINSISRRSQHIRWTSVTISILAFILLLLTLVNLLIPDPSTLRSSYLVAPYEKTNELDTSLGLLKKRADSPTDACLRMGQQSAIVNGSLYLYGGSTEKASNSSKISSIELVHIRILTG
jgi:hypothetical protein